MEKKKESGCENEAESQEKQRLVSNVASVWPPFRSHGDTTSVSQESRRETPWE